MGEGYEEPHLMAIKTVRVIMSFTKCLFSCGKNISIDEIRLDGLSVTVEHNPPRPTNFEKVVKKAKGGGKAPKKSAKASDEEAKEETAEKQEEEEEKDEEKEKVEE